MSWLLALRAQAGVAAQVPDQWLPIAAGDALSGADGGRLGGLRARLQALLQGSPLVDGPALLAQLRGTALWEEQVLLHSRVGGPGTHAPNASNCIRYEVVGTP